MVFSTLASYPDAVITVKHKGIIIWQCKLAQISRMKIAQFVFFSLGFCWLSTKVSSVH